MLNISATGFSVMLTADLRSRPPHFSEAAPALGVFQDWRVNWLAYKPHRDCVMTRWSSWGACQCSGLLRGQAMRLRSIAQVPSDNGEPCPSTHTQQRKCRVIQHRCPTPAPTPVMPTPIPTPAPTPLPALGFTTTHASRLSGKLQLRLCDKCWFRKEQQAKFRTVLASMLGISDTDVQVRVLSFVPIDIGVAVTVEYSIDTSDRVSAYEARANMHTTTFVGALGARLKSTINAIGDGYNTATFVSRTRIAAVTIPRIMRAPSPSPTPAPMALALQGASTLRQAALSRQAASEIAVTAHAHERFQAGLWGAAGFGMVLLLALVHRRYSGRGRSTAVLSSESASIDSGVAMEEEMALSGASEYGATADDGFMASVSTSAPNTGDSSNARSQLSHAYLGDELDQI